MRRIVTIAALAAELTSFATDMRELRAPAQRGDDYFEYFMAEDGDRESGEQVGDEYFGYVPDDGRAWGPVYKKGSGMPEPEYGRTELVLFALAPQAETPEGNGGWVEGTIHREDMYEYMLVSVNIRAYPYDGFTFGAWEKYGGGKIVRDQEYSYSFTEPSGTTGTSYIVWTAYFNGTGSGGPDTNEYVTVSAIASEGGSADGGGTIIKGHDFSVYATPDDKHIFDRWEEGSSIVGRFQNLSGTADTDRSFVAYFRPKPRRITCNVNETFTDEYGWAINEAWIASAGERSYGENTHTVEAFDGERVTIMARVAPKPNAVVIRHGRSSKGKYANHNDSWTLTHSFTVDGDDDWLVFFAEQKAEIICDRGGTILHKATNGMILRLKD